jgi:hypothetical protein
MTWSSASCRFTMSATAISTFSTHGRPGAPPFAFREVGFHVSDRLEIASSSLAYLAGAAFSSTKIRSIPASVTFSGKWVPPGVDCASPALND